MRASSRLRGVRAQGPGRVVAGTAIVALVAGCVGGPPSVGPTGSPATPTSTSSASSASPPATPRPTGSRLPTATPGPSTPQPTSPAPSGPPLVYSQPWEPTGPLAVELDWSDAVLLRDGRVLAVGGSSDRSQAPPSVQLFDPVSDTWSATTGLLRPRSEAALVALRDGRALVIGGLNGDANADDTQSYSSAYAFHPDTETWTKIGLMTTARAAPSAAVLPDGRVLVAGGYYYVPPDWSASVQRQVVSPSIVLAAYRPTEATEPLPSRPPLDDVDAPPHGYALATAEVYDPATDTWSETGSMRYARAGAAVATLADGRVLVVGSGSGDITGVHPDAPFSAEIYDPRTGRFSLAGQLPRIDLATVRRLGVDLFADRLDPAATGSLVALADGGALLVGNAEWAKHTADIVRTLRFDGRTLTWAETGQPCASAWDDTHTTLARTPGPCRMGAAVASLPDGRILVAGGTGRPMYSEEPTPTAELYDRRSGMWTPLPELPAGLTSDLDVALEDGSVLIVSTSQGWTPEGDLVRYSLSFRYAPSS